LLLDYGFDRFASPCGSDGSSSYTYWQSSGTIRLWGFGVAVIPAFGAAFFFRRYQWIPWAISPDILHAEVYLLGHVERFRASDSELSLAGHAFGLLCRHVADYEHWVNSHAGKSWRPQAIREGKNLVPQIRDMAGAWKALADQPNPRTLLQ
jgi:hypothetical protein